MKTVFIKILPLILCYVVSGIVSAQTPPEMKIDSAARTQVIENLLKSLNESYVFPETAKKMEEDLRKRLKNGEYEQMADGAAFAQKLTEDLQSVSKDKHLRVRFSNRILPKFALNTEPSAEQIAEQKLMQQVNNSGFVKIENMRGNIGYIDLRGFMNADFGEETVAAAMNFVANSDALIFDLRQNGGGDPKMVALISSYLFGDKPVHLNSLYWRPGNRTDEFWTKPTVTGKKFGNKPVYVLTANRTFSAAEEFSYNLKNLKRATIVGETTGGGAHPGSGARLSDHFQAFIPTGRAINPITKTNWEGTGVEPDVKVSPEKALKTAYLLALKESAKNQKDERFADALKKLITETETELAAMPSSK